MLNGFFFFFFAVIWRIFKVKTHGREKEGRFVDSIPAYPSQYLRDRPWKIPGMKNAGEIVAATMHGAHLPAT